MNSAWSRAGLGALIVVVLLFGALFSGTEAGADGIGPSGFYSFSDSDCNAGSTTDPVGVLFRGRRASAQNVARQIKAHTGWDHDANKSQRARVHIGNDKYECREADQSVASAPEFPPSGRYHTRLWWVPATAGTSELKTVGTPHHEDWVWYNKLNNDCDLIENYLGIGNHAVDEGGVNQGKDSGFDAGRHKLRDQFQKHGHKVVSEQWGNTQEFKQCDYDYAGSDGWGINVWIEHAMHPRTGKASSVKATSSTLNGTLTTEEPTTEWWFAYGPNTSQGVGGYPHKTATTTVSGPAEINVSQAISSLSANGTYHVRMFSRNQDGEVEEGNEVVFSTCGSASSDEDDDSPGPRVASQCNGVVDTFFRDANGNLGHHWWTPGNGWATETRPASIAPSSVPRVVTQANGTGAVDVFFRDTNGNLGHHWWTPGNGWATETREASMASDPHVVAQPNGVVDIFFRDTNGNLGHHWWTSSSGWATETRTASMASDPHVAVQPSTGTVDVFFRNTNGNLGHHWWTSGSGWATETRTASMASDPHVVAQSSGVVDVFFRNTNGNLGHHWWTPGNGWATETRTASIASSSVPRVVAQPNGVVDVFFRDTNGNLGHHWWTSGSGWSTETRTASMASDPHVVAQPNGVVDIFFRDTNGNLGHHWWTSGSGWSTETRTASMASDPHVSAQPNGNGVVDVFFRDINGNLGHHWWTPGNGWATETRTASIAARPPVVTTGSASGASASTATLSGTVDPENSPTTYYFEYGPTTAYGTKAPASSASLGYGGTSLSVSENLSGLTPGTTYHYRLVATSPEGTTKGEDKTFATESGVVPNQLAAMPVTEPFDGSTGSLADFSSKWAALGWATGGLPKGENTASGWRPASAYSTINGAYHESSLSDSGSGIAAVAEMAVNPANAERYFSLWLDMPTPAATRAGYELRFTNTATNTYSVKLSKWEGGTETVLASKTGVTFVNGDSFAIVDQGATVSAWTDTGSGFGQLISASDSAFSSGYAGLHGAGNITRLAKFKAGAP